MIFAVAPFANSLSHDLVHCASSLVVSSPPKSEMSFFVVGVASGPKFDIFLIFIPAARLNIALFSLSITRSLSAVSMAVTDTRLDNSVKNRSVASSALRARIEKGSRPTDFI